jgi:hypothetical protein
MAEEQKPSDEAPATPEAPLAAPPATPPRTRANVWIAVAVVLVAGAFLAMNLRHRNRPSHQPVRQVTRGADGGRAAPPAPGAAEDPPQAEAQSSSPVLNLLAPLRKGAQLGNAEVSRITEVVDGRILVTFHVGDVVGTYGIMLYTPAASDLLHTGRYVIYVHGTASPALNEIGPELVATLSRNQSVPAPPGLRAIDLSRH